MDSAKIIVESIWDKEVVEINGEYVLASNDLEKSESDGVLINPSYFAPYAYRIFSKISPDHNWQGLIDGSYKLIEESATEKLDTQTACGLAPDWAVVDRRTGGVGVPPRGANLTTNYSYDAMRLPFRLSLDWLWFKEIRAKQALEKMSFLGHDWQTNRRLSSTYSHACEKLSDTEAPAMYGTSVGYFLTQADPALKQMVDEKLHALYSPDSATWTKPLGYYDSNWAWFGLALYHRQLFNLTDNKNSN